MLPFFFLHYDKLVQRYIIYDDGYLNSCKQAVHDYRDKHNIKEPIMQIDWTGAYWKKAI